jgi:predicted metal-dependent phosphotriesterase family hydrolase
MKRRQFIQSASLAAGASLLPRSMFSQNNAAQIMGVLGVIQPSDLGVTLMHEHVMADFIGAEQTGRHRYKVEEVVSKAKPFILDLKNAGCKTFVDCTPVYLGRDARVLKQLASETGMNILTTTGYYGAFEEQFLPKHAYTETPQQLSTRWVNEWKNGIDDTGVRPGLIKTSVDAGKLRPIYQKVLTAVAMTHLQTGLTISAHTGNGVAAMEEIQLMQKNGVHPSAFRWVHAQNEPDKELHIRAAKLGAWLEFDGINESEPGNIEKHVDFVKHMKENGYLKQVLVSQDAGWYHVGEPNGGNFRGFTTVFTKFVPALGSSGFSQEEIDQLLVGNPRESLIIRVRKA